MAIQNVISPFHRGLLFQHGPKCQYGPKSQRGLTLIEMMVASLLGLMALSVTSQVMIRGQAYVAERSQQLLLVQNMNSVMQVLKEDLYQAGFDPGGSVTLSGGDDVIQSGADAASLGYVYRVAERGEQAYRNVVYRFDREEGVLRICEKALPAPLTFLQASDSGWGGNCYSLFEPRQIRVSEFRVTTRRVAGVQATALLTEVRLSALLTRLPQFSHSLSFQLLTRNGQ